MSGFDRALRGLSSREMLECAQGLLACLTGGERVAALGAADIADIEPVGRRGERQAAGAAREARGRGGPGAKIQRRAGPGAKIQRRAGDEYGAGGYPDARGFYEWDTADAGGGEVRGGGVTAEARHSEEYLYGGADPAARGGTSGGEVNPASGAAFCGPERRYDGAVGARGMEMSRVSEFFRRDSRRYDAGCGLKQ